MIDLTETVAVVTGGASGIGTACVQRLHELGATVDVWDRSPAPDGALGDGITYQLVDVTDPDSTATAAASVGDRFGRADILVNCAGVITANLPAQDTPAEDFRTTFEVNTLGTANTARALFPLLRAAGGRGAIVNVASQAALVSLPNQAAYSTSKGAVAALTRAMAIDWGSAGVRVNAVCPGFTLTPMAKQQMTPELNTALSRRVPLGRIFEPHEIANVIVFLASEAASAVTGVVMPVDGGWTAGEPALPL
jgi:NAD(P)-dependent dehydrogenase (short-subunit alcohol dehydrogenase family)